MAHAGAWLAMVPSVRSQGYMEAPDFRAALKWWLGMPQMAENLAGTPCPQCQTPMDIVGDHVVCCKFNHISRRHMAMHDALMAVVQGVGMACRRGAQLQNSSQRPGDHFHSQMGFKWSSSN